MILILDLRNISFEKHNNIFTNTFVSPTLHQAMQVTSSVCPESCTTGAPGLFVRQIYASSSLEPLAI